jgi:hypothetical protein
MMVYEIPATVTKQVMGRLQETGISQKTCQRYLIFKAFGKKSIGSFIDSPPSFFLSNEYLTRDELVCRTKTL